MCRILSSVSAVVAALAVSTLAASDQAPEAGQGAAPKLASEIRSMQEWLVVPPGWTPPKTAWGDPELQGVWSYGTLTPLERRPEFGDRAMLTPAEMEDLRKEQKKVWDAGFGPYNDVWLDVGPPDGRTSIIVDPPNGRRPPLTPEAQKRLGTLAASEKGRRLDSWEQLALKERCIAYHGVPPIPTLYGNDYHIVQAPGYVVMVDEELTGPRRIPTNGSSHPNKGVTLWNGDSRGRWEGNTLVVETTNFRDDAETNGIMRQANMPTYRVVERFTRVAPSVIELRFTVDDPTTWVRPWTGIIYMPKIGGPLYEYACHERNEALVGILRGARAEEQRAAEGKASGDGR